MLTSATLNKTNISMPQPNDLLLIKKGTNGSFRILLDGNTLYNFIESTPFTAIPYYEDKLNLLKKKGYNPCLDMTHPAFDHPWQTPFMLIPQFSLQNIPTLDKDNNNSIVYTVCEGISGHFRSKI
jgi:hypothetical protein